jgi:hypothetical protein
MLLLNLIPAPYRWLAVAMFVASVFLAGTTSGWKLKSYFAKSEIEKIEAAAAIDKAIQAAAIARSTNEARAKEKEHAKFRDAVEAKYQEAVLGNRVLSERVRRAAAAVGLRDPGARPGCANLPGSAAPAGIPASAAASTGDQLSGAAVEFLLAEAARADEVAAYATACNQWANKP